MSNTHTEFLKHYIMAALWSTNDNADESGGEPLDKNYGAEDIAPETLAKMKADCEKFQAENADDLATRETKFGAHDFWLSRNGHGAGFFDGDWPEETGDRLQEKARQFGEINLYVGDNGLIYQ